MVSGVTVQVNVRREAIVTRRLRDGRSLTLRREALEERGAPGKTGASDSGRL